MINKTLISISSPNHSTELADNAVRYPSPETEIKAFTTNKSGIVRSILVDASAYNHDREPHPLVYIPYQSPETTFARHNLNI